MKTEYDGLPVSNRKLFSIACETDKEDNETILNALMMNVSNVKTPSSELWTPFQLLVKTSNIQVNHVECKSTNIVKGFIPKIAFHMCFFIL